MTFPDQRIRVLVVEDCPNTADSLRTLLELWGYKVRVARDGLAGLVQARWFCPDLALIDLTLPGLDGLELGYILSRLPEPFRPALVAATGRSGPDVHREAWETGFDYFLPKPFDVDRLRDILVGVTAGSNRPALRALS
jgi:two-component system, sensor histidine kinase